MTRRPLTTQQQKNRYPQRHAQIFSILRSVPQSPARATPAPKPSGFGERRSGAILRPLRGYCVTECDHARLQALNSLKGAERSTQTQGREGARGEIRAFDSQVGVTEIFAKTNRSHNVCFRPIFTVCDGMICFCRDNNSQTTMTPIDAYRHTSERAWRVYRLHDGLVDMRRRAMRSDWKKRFCSLMHWNQSDEISRVDSREAIIILRDGARLSRDDFSVDAIDDLLRSALVLGVSALDRYVHERVIRGIVKALRRPNLNRTQEDFSIPASLSLEIAQALQRAARKKQKLRPANEIRNKVQDILHKRPFQSWREIQSAFELLGVNDLAGQLQTLYTIGDFGPKKDYLNKIITRRNWIVHEGDLIRHRKGGKARCHEITPKFVREGLEFMDSLSEKLDLISA